MEIIITILFIGFLAIIFCQISAWFILKFLKDISEFIQDDNIDNCLKYNGFSKESFKIRKNY